jgi:hypothetical protein
MCALYAISDSSFCDVALARVSEPFYMIFSFCDDHKMKSSGIISPLKMEGVWYPVSQIHVCPHCHVLMCSLHGQDSGL